MNRCSYYIVRKPSDCSGLGRAREDTCELVQRRLGVVSDTY
jgi:hypothetical protein